MNTTQKAKLAPTLGASFASLFYPQVLLVMFVPLLVSIFLVVLGLWFSKDFWLSYFDSGPLALQPYWQWLLAHTPQFLHPIFNFLSGAAPWVLFILLFVLSYPLIVSLNLAIVSVLASTYLVKFLARREYKDLEFKGRSRFVAGLLNTVVSMVLFLLAWLITLPLWLIPGLGFVVPLLLTAWLNRRICSFDALTDLATDEEMKRVPKKNSLFGYLLGLIATALNYIPFAFFISPVMTMVMFIHFNLQALALDRQQNR